MVDKIRGKQHVALCLTTLPSPISNDVGVGVGNLKKSLVKKHYHRFALLVHPDKNKFEGSTEAFKILNNLNAIIKSGCHS